MLVAILGWATVCAIVIVTVAVIWLMWLAQRKPWRFRTRVHVPREVRGVEWEEPMQDLPIPWI